MNYKLPYIPERDEKPRKKGLTMVMDKGLSVQESKNLCNSSGHIIDYLKLGFGTSLVSTNLKEKIKIYQDHNIKVYLGGTLFEAFIIRNMYDDFKKYVSEYNIDMIEVSDGSMHMEHDVKCEYIRKLSKEFTVISEVGSKEAGIIIAPNKWIKMMKNELEAGSINVIAEARESGTVGIYRPNGNAHVVLINKILENINADSILWEAPNKSQQVWFVKLLGANVNLGNIAPNEVISLETIRLGLRGDTFFNFLPEEFKEEVD
ncbi:MAG: phosphosulfolactate synthase [Bacteroidetes bacterium CG23_combo_of_CG06-09_8_20_14_all_32_9]|nr:MAG: phosphosulfolactate synthase [Bacteroidetes bacterium CG23_combo_of_CG06-09_8_20_14_all_32_9]